MSSEVTLKAAEGPGYLRFERLDDENFLFEARTGRFSGSTEVSTFQAGSPARFFAAMAANWRGWKGKVEWEDLERVLQLTGTIDSLGHVTVGACLWGDLYTSTLKVELLFDAGQLEEMARLVAGANLGSPERPAATSTARTARR